MTQHNSHNADAVMTILNSLDALIYVSDMQTYDLLYVNEYGTALWGKPAKKKCFEYLQSNQTSPCTFCTNHKLVDAKGEPSGPYVWEFQNTVTDKWYQCRDQAVYWPDGRLVRIEIATDITNRKIMEQQLATAKAEAERLASIDDLTQLYNRRAFFQLANPFFMPDTTVNTALALIMFDIDYFKKINDAFGHAAGDKVLVNVAGLLKEIQGSNVIPARLGGEEFAIFLPETTQQQAYDLAEQLRQQMMQQKLLHAHGLLAYTASFGVVARTQHHVNSTLEQLINAADHVMMQAKRLGRNQTITA